MVRGFPLFGSTEEEEQITEKIEESVEEIEAGVDNVDCHQRSDIEWYCEYDDTGNGFVLRQQFE